MSSAAERDTSVVSLLRTRKNFREWMGEARDALASVFFPAPCRLCESLLDTASALPLCAKCLASLGPAIGAHCLVCGRPFVSASPALDSAALCHACRRGIYNFDRARSYAAYDGEMVHAITLLKYEPIEPLGRWFAERLAELIQREAEMLEVDVVVPVPLHPARQRERGYNQADLIARPLARRLKLPYRSVLLVRTKPRPDKLKLTLHERWETVRGAFAARPGSQVDNLRVLLVDDVMTTGATLDACAKALKQAGAAKVVAVTVARALRGGRIVPGSIIGPGRDLR